MEVLKTDGGFENNLLKVMSHEVSEQGDGEQGLDLDDQLIGVGHEVAENYSSAKFLAAESHSEQINLIGSEKDDAALTLYNGANLVEGGLEDSTDETLTDKRQDEVS